jgi:hypothetical protein
MEFGAPHQTVLRRLIRYLLKERQACIPPILDHSLRSHEGRKQVRESGRSWIEVPDGIPSNLIAGSTHWILRLPDSHRAMRGFINSLHSNYDIWHNSSTLLPGHPFVITPSSRDLTGSPMSNINGKVYAMNVVTPMKRWKTPILRLLFWALSAFKAFQSDLIQLKFIQFARWSSCRLTAFPILAIIKKEIRSSMTIFSS